MPRAQSPSDSIPSLLSWGLDHYGRNEVDEAVRCWRRVLELDPQHAIARDYLETAGAGHDTPRGADVINLGAARAQFAISSAPPAASNTDRPSLEASDSGAPHFARPQLEGLLREHRYEEALTLLYAARARNPRNSEIPRSIRLLRERLTADYAHQLGDLDRVPMLAPGALELNGDEQQVAALVDGISSYFDIAAASPIGRLPTLRILSALASTGQLVAAQVQPEWPVSSRPLARSGVTAAYVASAPPAAEVIATVSEPAPESEQPATFRRARGDDGDYSELFASATQAYLLRDMELAMELFGECCRRRPEDPRPHHNLKALSRRVGK